MELNRLLDKKLTKEQKMRFKRDNGKFKVLNTLIILPVITAILGVFLESIIVVSISIVLIIAFLLVIAFSTKKRNVVYEEVIIPSVLQEKLSNIDSVINDESVESEFEKSELFIDYLKFEAKNFLRIHEDRYSIEISKVILNNEKNEDEESDKVFSGIFAYVTLPNLFGVEFTVKENLKNAEQTTSENNNTSIVKMNNIDFDKQYEVLAKDTVSVKKVLSLGVMARILEINKKMGKVINFSVKNNTLYVLINYDEFLNFKSNKKDEYVDEKIATENMDILDLLDYFVRYFVNLTEI